MIYLVDFDDSFTGNIKAELILAKIKVTMVHWQEQLWHDQHHVILGPGPGSPTQYHQIFTVLSKRLNNPLSKTVGICLGHQILGILNQQQLVEASEKVHGQSVEVQIPNWPWFLQLAGKKTKMMRYNSLCVKVITHKQFHQLNSSGESIFSFGRNYFSMQYHPESLGTPQRRYFFSAIREFLYNRNHEAFFAEYF